MVNEIAAKLICEELKLFRKFLAVSRGGLSSDLAARLDQLAASELAARKEKKG